MREASVKTRNSGRAVFFEGSGLWLLSLSGCVKGSRVPAMGIALGLKEYKGQQKFATFVALHIDSLYELRGKWSHEGGSVNGN